MKKSLFVFVFALALSAFGGWSNDELAALYKKAPNDCLVFDEPVVLNGYHEWSAGGNGIWFFGSIETSDNGLSWHYAGNYPVSTYSNFGELLSDGWFDDEESIDVMLDLYNKKVYDEMEEMEVSMYADSPLVEFYWKEMTANIYTVKSASLAVSAKILAKAEEKKQGGAAGGSESSGLTEEEAKDIDAMKDAVEEQKEQVKEQVEKLEDAAEETTKALKEAEVDLAKFNEEKSAEASKSVAEAVNSLDSAMTQLDLAIANNDFNALSIVNDKLNDTITALGDATDLISGIQSEEYDQARSKIESASIVIAGARLNITSAQQNKDMSLARTARAALAGLSRLSEIKKAIRHGDIMGMKAKGAVAKESDKLNALLNLIDAYKDLKETVESIGEKLKDLCQRYMTDMNTLGAYLGSTNAMQYFSAKREWKDMDDESIKRWFKFSRPEKIKGSPSYYEDFNIGGRNWYSVFHNFQSEYFLQALPFDAEDKLRAHFNMPAMSIDNYRGFYEMPDDNLVKTNWYASKITAPKNWADGSSIIVTNGKFKVASALSDKYALKIIGTTASNYKLIGAPASKTNTVTFASAANSNVAVTIGGNNDTVTITIGVYYK